MLCLAMTASTSIYLKTIINKIGPITLKSQIFLEASCGYFLSNVFGKEADMIQIAVDYNLDKASDTSISVPKVHRSALDSYHNFSNYISYENHSGISGISLKATGE